MGKKLDKWERQQAEAKRRRQDKKRRVLQALDLVDALYKATQERLPDGKPVWTELEAEAISDASYSLRSVLSGWVNNKRGARRG